VGFTETIENPMSVYYAEEEADKMDVEKANGFLTTLIRRRGTNRLTSSIRMTGGGMLPLTRRFCGRLE
jgi:hypothetical protein